MTSKPIKFISNSDYATLANDSSTETITVNIPATSIGIGATQAYTGSITLGTAGSPIEYDINYPSSTRLWKTPELLFVEGTFPNQYQGYITLYKSGATTVTMQVTVFYGGPNASTTKTARAVTARVRTFIPPFN